MGYFCAQYYKILCIRFILRRFSLVSPIKWLAGREQKHFWVIFLHFKNKKLLFYMNFFHVFVHKLLPGCLVAAHITRVFHPFMNCSFVLGKRPLWSCHIVTLLARVLHPFMNCSFVSGKTPLWSCHIVTLPARVLYPFMHCSFVLGKIHFLCCLMVTLPAREPHPFTLWSHSF